MTAVYLATSIVITWPLATVMRRQIAGDLGDPLFNCWILQWTGGQVLNALRGDFSALSRYWDANIFYPAPLTLAVARDQNLLRAPAPGNQDTGIVATTAVRAVPAIAPPNAPKLFARVVRKPSRNTASSGPTKKPLMVPIALMIVPR